MLWLDKTLNFDLWLVTNKNKSTLANTGSEDTWQNPNEIFLWLILRSIFHLPISAGKRVEHRICIDLTFSRMNKNVGDSVSVTPIYIIIVLSNDPICNKTIVKPCPQTPKTQPSSKPKLVSRGLGLTLKSCRPQPTYPITFKQ